MQPGPRRNCHSRSRAAALALAALAAAGALPSSIVVGQPLEMVQGYGFPATISSRTGSVQISHVAQRPADEKVYPGTHVITRSGGRVEIDFATPLVAVRIGPFSSLRFPESGAEDVHLFEGAALFFKRYADRDLPLRVGDFHAAIKGTSFLAQVVEAGSEIVVIDGSVVVELAAAAPGGELSDRGIPVGPWEKLVLRKGQPPEIVPLRALEAEMQWFLYYPIVVEAPRLVGSVDPRWRAAAEAFAQGRMVEALAALPEPIGADALPWQIKLAAMLKLSVGNIGEADTLLDRLPVLDAERRAISAVGDIGRGLDPWQALAGAGPAEGNVSLLLARSYALQVRGELARALASAEDAVSLPGAGGFARFRYAELLSYVGERDRALAAVDEALRHASAFAPALALKTLLLADSEDLGVARNRLTEATRADPFYPLAWTLRGLLDLRGGDIEGGTQDLLTSVSKNPLHALSRVYLSEGWRRQGQEALRLEELASAIKLDPQDPSGYFFRALAHRDANRTNAALLDLRAALDRNANRALFRSQQLLRMDSAARRANIAAIYEEAALSDWARREASLAAASDYGSAGSHLFLSNSYDALRDQGRLFLRLDTAWRSEQLIANLLAPPGSATLPQHGSLQEFSPLIASRRHGLNAETEYRSDSLRATRGTAYAGSGDLSAAYDFEHRAFDGDIAHDREELWEQSIRVRYEADGRSALFLDIRALSLDAGEVLPAEAALDESPNRRFEEDGGPNLIAGLSRKWSARATTLFAAGTARSDYVASDRARSTRMITDVGGVPIQLFDLAVPMNRSLDTSARVGFAEAQHYQTWGNLEAVVGARHQWGDFETKESLVVATPAFQSFFETDPASRRSTEATLDRSGAYGYFTWDFGHGLRPTVGASYYEMDYPVNFRQPPTVSGTRSTSELSPKLGIVWQPVGAFSIQAIRARSLGGVSLDASYQLEPTQVAGLLQTYRTLIPESLFGTASGQFVDVAGATAILAPTTRIHFALDAFEREARADESFGIFTRFVPDPFVSASQAAARLRYREREIGLSAHALLGERASASVSVMRVDSRASMDFVDVAAEVSPLSRQRYGSLAWRSSATLAFNFPGGWFAKIEAEVIDQEDRSATRDLGDASVSIFGARAGYRSSGRRFELEAGALNLGDQFFALNGLTDEPDQPRERSLYLRARVNL